MTRQELIEAARVMWERGETTRRIATQLGVTRNVIIGLAHRNGFSKRESPILRGVIPKRQRNHEAKSRVRGLEAPQRAVEGKAAPTPREAQINEIGGITTGCRWIYGEPVPPLWCGKPIERGSYCQEHYDRCYFKPVPKLRTLEKKAIESTAYWPTRSNANDW